MKKPQFVQDQIYHIYNRGVEKRKTFMDDQDYLRFIHDLFEFNDKELVTPSNSRFKTRKPSTVKNTKIEQCLEVELPNIARKPRKLLVEILSFCLMPNHFHLVLRQLTKNGIVKFMQKLGTGYTNYFNKKQERVGALFQGRFKAVLIEQDKHFMYLPHYIHLNPLDLTDESLNLDKKIKFLENYRWSSLPDYLDKKNFPSLTQRDFFLNFFGTTDDYKKDLFGFIKKKSSINDLGNHFYF